MIKGISSSVTKAVDRYEKTIQNFNEIMKIVQPSQRNLRGSLPQFKYSLPDGTPNFLTNRTKIKNIINIGPTDEKPVRLKSSAAGTVLPLSLGPDFQSVIKKEDILRCFKTNIADGEAALKQSAFEGTILAVPFSTSFTESRVITRVEDVEDMMEIDGSLSVSYGPMISGEGSGNFLKTKVDSKYQASVLYRTRRVAFARSIDVDTILVKGEVLSLTEDEITDRYGSKFIDQMLFGAQLDVIFSITSTVEIDMEEIEAELKGKIGVGALSIEFSAKFEESSGSSQSELSMSIITKASGVEVSTPSNPSFDQVNELITDFNNKYDSLLEEASGLENLDDVSNPLNQLSPVAFGLSSLADYIPQLNKFEVSFLDTQMSAMGDVFYSANFLKYELLAIRDIQEELYSDPKDRDEIFEPYALEMDRIIDALDNTIQECLAFRREPFANIVGRNGDPTPVPDYFPHPTNEWDMDTVQGLQGEAYISSPLTLTSGGPTYNDVHYVGFALLTTKNCCSADFGKTCGETMGSLCSNKQLCEKDICGGTWISSSLEPWMGGTVRHDVDDSIIATANTVEDLERLTEVVLHSPYTPKQDATIRGGDYSNVNYGSSAHICVKTKQNDDTMTRKTIMEFDIPYPTSINKALLQLQLLDSNDGWKITIRRIDDVGWAEETVTWNKWNALHPVVLKDGGTIEGGIDDFGKIFSVDVSDLIVVSNNPKIIFLLEDLEGRNRNTIFHSKESSGIPPQLHVWYDASDSRRK